jgi:hypothetical protein
MEKREKFLKRVKIAAKHLLDVYYPKKYHPDSENLSLSQHPSHGIKPFADRVYKTVEQHWQCDCPKRIETRVGKREARLSLVRHRRFGPKTVSRSESGRGRAPSVKFELLFPLCEHSSYWKITTVEAKDLKYDENWPMF